MADRLYYEDITEGEALPTLEKTPSTRQLAMYAGASGDYYEIHYDQEFAKARGLPSVIVHGALKSGFLGQLLTDWIGDRGRIRKLEVQYRGMDIQGEAIDCKGRVTRRFQEDGQDLVECEVWTENPSGDRTTRGTALVSLPSSSD